MTHKSEIVRWSNCPDDTNIWCKYTRWELQANPRWFKDVTYIVDDEYAEIRKQFVDDKSKVEIRIANGSWVETSLPSIEGFTKALDEKPELYRIKPDEQVYEYQWLIRCKTSGIFDVTKKFRTKDEFICNDEWEVVKKIEESKRKEE